MQRQVDKLIDLTNLEWKSFDEPAFCSLRPMFLISASLLLDANPINKILIQKEERSGSRNVRHITLIRVLQR